MTIWADWNHEVVYKGPEHLQNNDKVLAYSLELAEYYMMLDNLRAETVPICPNVLKATNGSKVFSHDNWKNSDPPIMLVTPGTICGQICHRYL